ncbi:MAG: hypothetical protein CM15mP120_24200 [Pseudomonadota bacterium]|nr:MAG: hypothetical protein CM15mP120_24200 [Pseudomonadota bacterium]
MLKLYHCKDARSFRALWALEKFGLGLQLINMEFPPRAPLSGFPGLKSAGHGTHLYRRRRHLTNRQVFVST